MAEMLRDPDPRGFDSSDFHPKLSPNKRADVKFCAVVLCLTLVLTPDTTAAQETLTDSEIEWAGAYQQPIHKCSRPKIKKSNEVAGKVARYQRKVARFAKCVRGHQQILMADHQRIVRIVKGTTLTQEQANDFATKLKSIEETIAELGADVDISTNPTDMDRILRIGNRPSAT